VGVGNEAEEPILISPTKEAYKIFHEGQEALSLVEAAGIRLDMDYLDRTTKRACQKAEEIEAELKETEIWAAWKKRFREKANIASGDQLGEILFGKRGMYEAKKKTATGKPDTSEDALMACGDPFVKPFLNLKKLRKMESTYLQGLIREADQNGFLHPSFGLNRAITYRSNSSNPNFQNIPVRDPRLGKMIRRAFVPREGNVFVEVDYSSLEVRIAACYHKDPTMLDYIRTGHDLHKDMAVECFSLKPDQVSKQARFEAKSNFVFAEFYGDWWKSVAKCLWDRIADLPEIPCIACEGSGESSNGGGCVPCVGAGSSSIYAHLASKGISSLGAYEKHIEKVENRFWKERFSRYDQWRDYWWDKYKKRGWFQMKTGFVCQGIYRRNEVINYAVQGAAFHCLLWSLTQIVKELKQRGFKALVVGQIHDSVILDIPEAELEKVLALVRDIMCMRLREEWHWIITPMEIEAEGSRENWHEKQELEIPE